MLKMHTQQRFTDKSTLKQISEGFFQCQLCNMAYFHCCSSLRLNNIVRSAFVNFVLQRSPQKKSRRVESRLLSGYKPTGVLCMRCTTRKQATHIFFENGKKDSQTRTILLLQLHAANQIMSVFAQTQRKCCAKFGRVFTFKFVFANSAPDFSIKNYVRSMFISTMVRRQGDQKHRCARFARGNVQLRHCSQHSLC